MNPPPVTVGLPDEAATRRLGARIAASLAPGTLVLLEGDLGAGKTFLARAIIQHLAGAAIEVASPTFSLAVPYELPGFPLLHVDLYRLGGPDEVEELGIEDALETGAVLVEWPDRLPPELAARGRRVRLVAEPVRQAEIDCGWTTPGADAR